MAWRTCGEHSHRLESGKMARGREEHEARNAALRSFGKDLARRAKSKCELCEKAGEGLSIFEVPPVPRDPDPDRCLLLCGNCLGQVEEPRRFRGGDHWRFLCAQAWSEIPMVQIVALRLLKRQTDKEAWARDALDEIYLDEATEALVTEGV